MPNTDRYVINTAFEYVWHRVNEQKIGVYNAVTQCGLTFQYTSVNVIFRHPSMRRHLSNGMRTIDCQKCKSSTT